MVRGLFGRLLAADFGEVDVVDGRLAEDFVDVVAVRFERQTIHEDADGLGEGADGGGFDTRRSCTPPRPQVKHYRLHLRL
jgi:hypothetical protein